MKRQTIEQRLSELEDKSTFEEYETGAWIILEHAHTRYSLLTSRLGRFEFSSEADMNSFIKQHHKGSCPEWSKRGIDGFIKVKYASGEQPAKK